MAARDGIVVGNGNLVGGNTKRFALINCHNMSIDDRHNGMSFIGNAIATPQKSTNATASSPVTVSGVYGLYYCDATAGNVIINFDNPDLLTDVRIYFKRIDTSNNKIIFNAFGSELLEFKAMPQNNILKKQGDSVLITANGTNWFIL